MRKPGARITRLAVVESARCRCWNSRPACQLEESTLIKMITGLFIAAVIGVTAMPAANAMMMKHHKKHHHHHHHKHYQMMHKM